MASGLDGVLQCGAYFPGTVLAIFRAADVNGDGLVSGKEAIDFFLSTGLAQGNLSQVWDSATSSQPGGLTPAQFSRALRLVSLLQIGCAFTKEFIDKALHPTTGLQLPTPKVGSQFLSDVPEGGHAKASDTSPAQADKAPPAQPAAKPAIPPAKPPVKPAAKARAKSAERQAVPRSPATKAMPARTNGDAVASDNHRVKFRQEHHTCAAPPAITVEASTGGMSQDTDREGGEMDDEAALTANAWRRHSPADTLRIDLRLQPHSEASAAPLQRLAAVKEMLLAAPTRAGGMACYARAEYKPSEPAGYWPMVRNGEDPASVAGKECRPERIPCGAVTAMHACLYTDTLISGHKDGNVLVWHLDMSNPDPHAEPPMQQRLLLHAHSRSAVVAVLTTAWGALWTAGSSGSLRLWPTAMHAATRAGNTTALDWAALPQRELRRATGERAHGSIAALQLTSGGQVVIASSRLRATLWDALSGRFLGVVALHGTPLDTPALIDPSSGMPMALDTGRAVSSPEGPLAPLGTPLEELLPTEEAKLAAKLNSVAITTTSFAKKGFSGMKHIVSRQISKGREALMAQQAQQGQSQQVLAPADECGADPEEPSEQQVGGVRRIFIVCTPDNCFWSINEHGVVEVFAASGQHLVKFEAAWASAVTCAAAFGSLVWLGLLSGRVVAVDCWTHERAKAQDLHDSAVIDLQQVGLVMYALSKSGAVAGINACVLPKNLPSGGANHRFAFWQGCWRRALDTWRARASDSTEAVAVGVRAATWNVGEVRPGRESMRKLLGTSKSVSKGLSLEGIDILVVGLQEIEMGTASVAVGAVKEVMGKRVAEQVNHNARWWADEMHACLEEHSQGGGFAGAGSFRNSWERSGLRQMSGLLLCVFVRRAMGTNVTNVATGVVACGVGGFGGNKGAVAVSMQLFRKRLLLLTSHFAAHQGAVKKRNADYSAILRRIAMPNQPGLVATENPQDEPPPGHLSTQSLPPVLRSAASPERRGSIGHREDSLPNPAELAHVGDTDAVTPAAAVARPDAAAIAFRSASMVIWCGDFNYRIEMDRQAVESAVVRQPAPLDTLKEQDQARQQMAAGAVFHGMREAPLVFPPTYKFDKGDSRPFAYDSSEKQRVPAWTDRIFFKGSVPFPLLESPKAELDFSSQSPYSTPGLCRESPDQLLARCSHYDCIPDVYDSDHKPVIARLRAEVPNIDYKKRRRHVAQVLSQLHEEVTSKLAPHIRLPSTKVVLHDDSTVVTISNNGHGDGTFFFRGSSLPPGDGAAAIEGPTMMPVWLSVFPHSGVVPAGGSANVHITVNKTQAAFQSSVTSDHKTMHVDLFMVVDGLRQGGTTHASSNVLKLEASFKNVLV